MNYLGIILIVAGGFSIVCAMLDFDWFMGSRKALFLVKLLSRNGARIFYVLLGLALVVLGILSLLGIVR